VPNGQSSAQQITSLKYSNWHHEDSTNPTCAVLGIAKLHVDGLAIREIGDLRF
jgi:hypothetical protein